MRQFVDGPPSWAFTRQNVWNNHPAFSFLESVVADVTGSTTEPVMRLLPCAFAALAVAVIAWRVGLRWGVRSGVCAGVVVAAHPMLIPLARDVRGYSLAVLAVVLIGVAVLDVRSPLLLAVAAAVGVGTHLYVVIPFAAAVAWLLGERRWDRRWRVAVVAGLVGGASFYVGMLDELGRQESSGRVFRPDFPVDATWALLGGTAVAVAAFAAVVVVAMQRTRWTPGVILAGAVLVGGVVGPWLLAPPDLYPRFVYWAVPVLALVAGWCVHHVPTAAGLVAVGAAIAVAPIVPDWMRDEIPNRAVADVAPADACAPEWMPEQLDWYLDRPVGTDCPAGVLVHRSLSDGVAADAVARWPVVCWEDRGVEVRAVDRAAC